MKIGLEQKQTLNMVMTTELRQAIELLEMSTYDLYQFIQKQAEENPFLEVIESDSSSYQTRLSTGQSMISPDEVMAATLQNEVSIYDDLLEQLLAFTLTEKEELILQYLIYNIDEDGYLDIAEEDVLLALNITEADYEAAKVILHKLEPAGIGAVDLQECLYIQAKKLAPSDTVLHDLIQYHLHDVANLDIEIIAEQLETTEAVVIETIDKLKTLNPKPASILENRVEDTYVEPDIIVSYDEAKDDYKITLNDYYLPTITFNEAYANEIKQVGTVSSYVQQQFRKYEWLQASLEKRRTTMMEIMQVLINKQRQFLQNGFRALRPLTLNHVAEKINKHESTVSRATANKIITTPIGTFDLRQLFSTPLQTKEGGAVSQMKVKLLIQELIQEENKQRPLSDQSITNILNERKIVISRRTVAKYREELRILSSSKRRQK